MRAASRALLETAEIAPGVHVRTGLHEEANRANGGAIANVGFVIGRAAVAVIDPGGSLADGERLRTRIRELTRLPIRYVVLTHVHPDHLFGAGAFQQDSATFVGHARLPRALAQRGEYYQRRLDEVLGKGKAGPVVQPTRVVTSSERIDLGDRVLELQAHALAHSDCDLTVLDTASGTLFASDLVFVERVPSLDGSVRGWLNELRTLGERGARRVVPGHGPASVDWPTGTAPLRRYLQALLDETRRAIADGVEIDSAPTRIAQSERAKWVLFDEYHGHNVTKAFKELEWE